MKNLLTGILVVGLSGCATEPANVPDTTILSEIQETLDAAVFEQGEELENLSGNDIDLLNELIPSLSLDENLLAPVEQRIDISTPQIRRQPNFSPALWLALILVL